MNSTRWKLITDIALAALELQEDERATFLSDRCVDANGTIDAELRQDVEEFVATANEAESNSAFDSPLAGIVAKAADDEELQETTIPGIIGPWRPVKRLGSGGMGVVYEAVRVDETFEQRVALKLIRTGFANDLAARFLRERALLANLKHPGIAQLLDGGVAPDGTPYFATELVEGSNIIEYSKSRDLSINDRLRLFMQSCGAVAYAHNNLVIHRDLKPSHVIITEASGNPTAKLLDFGIAKFADSDDDLTRVGRGPYTLTYASPEQVFGSAVTTSSDVYSLGVILYELVSGSRPYDLADKSAGQAEKLITETKPLHPSQATPGNVGRHRIPQDVDHIIMKAIAKEPDRRYHTAQSLQDDIGRFLDGLPVEATPESSGYIIRKFVARNRRGVAIAAAVLAMTAVLVSAFTLSLARERNRARDAAAIATSEAERSQAIADFLEDILRAPNSRWYVDADNKGPETPIRSVLDEAGRRVDRDFESRPDLQADLHHILGDTYMALGAHEPTAYHHGRALALRESVYDAPHPKIAEAIYYISYIEGSNGKILERATRLRQAVDMLRQNNQGNNFPFILLDLADIGVALNRFDVADGLLVEAHNFVDQQFVAGSSGFQYRDTLITGIRQNRAQYSILAGDTSAAANAQKPSVSENVSTYSIVVAQCYDGFANSVLGRNNLAEQALILCISNKIFEDRDGIADIAIAQEVLERPASIRGRAAATLYDLYQRQGRGAEANELEQLAVEYHHQVDSLNRLFDTAKIFDNLIEIPETP